MATDAGGGGGPDIGRTIADHERAPRIHRPVSHRLLQHAGPGLAQIGVLAVLRDDAVGMERAVLEAVDVSTFRPELVAHPVVQALDRFLVVVAVGDAGLVGDDEGVVAAIVGPADRLARAVDPVEVVAAMHVPGVLVQHAVAIEEDCRPPDDVGHHRLRAGEFVVQANFNMMDVRAQSDGLFDEVARRQAGFIGRTPLCFGFLAGTIRRDTIFPNGDHRNGWSRAQLDNWIDGAADLLAAVSARPGAEGAESALRFCLSFLSVSSVIPGILTPAEAAENARASASGPLPAPAVEAVLAINRRRQFFVRAATSS